MFATNRAGIDSRPRPARLSIILSKPAAKLIRRAALARGEREGTGGNISQLIEGLIRDRWEELEKEAASLAE